MQNDFHQTHFPLCLSLFLTVPGIFYRSIFVLIHHTVSWPWRVTSGLHRSFVLFLSVLLNSNHLTSCLSLLLFLFHLLFVSNPFIMVAHKNVLLKWIAARRCCYSSRRRKRRPEREREKETIRWLKRQLARQSFFSLIKVRIIWRTY